MLLWFLAPVALLLLLVLVLRPRGSHIVLNRWPSTLSLYAQAVLSMLTKGKSHGKHQLGPHIKVELARPSGFDASRLAGFLRLANYPGTHGTVPLMAPIAVSFRLNIQAMVLPAFPFNVVGSVLARHSCTLTRAVGADEQLVFSVEVDPRATRTTPKGDTEVDLTSRGWAVPRGTATGSRATSDLGAPVWLATLTVIILNPQRTKGGSAAAAATPAPAPPTWRVIDTWKLGGDVGRRYGAINGDLNPIHLYPATSRLFGFKRPIAHALFLMSRAEAALRRSGVEPAYPVQLDAEFKRPTLLPATLKCAVADSSSGAKGEVSFAVLTEDEAKEVLVGRLGPVRA